MNNFSIISKLKSRARELKKEDKLQKTGEKNAGT